MIQENTEFLTTSQAATLLQVHESSVKRWSNLGELIPEKTTGGHRRIPIGNLIDFAKRKGVDTQLLKFAPHEEAVAWAALAARERNDYSALQDLILQFCDVEPPRFLTMLFRFLESGFELSLTRIFDSAVGGALREVGRQWQSGSRTIALEHRFTQKVVDGLYGILGDMDNFPVPPKPNSHAIIASAEGCHHEIGALMARILLQRLGWSVTYLGVNTPFEEIAGIQELERAKLVCLSFVPPLNPSDVRRCLKVLGALYQPNTPYSLILGGSSVDANTQDGFTGPFSALKFANSIEALERYVVTRFGNREAL